MIHFLKLFKAQPQLDTFYDFSFFMIYRLKVYQRETYVHVYSMISNCAKTNTFWETRKK